MKLIFISRVSTAVREMICAIEKVHNQVQYILWNLVSMEQVAHRSVSLFSWIKRWGAQMQSSLGITLNI